MTKAARRVLFLCSTLLASPALAQQAPNADSPPDQGRPEAAPSGGLEDIVVTAQRRSENLQQTPVAVTALTAVEIERRGLDQTLKLGQNIPGLTTKAGTGTYSAGVFFIRGIGQQSLFNTLDPGVGVYIDDVYVGRTVFGARAVYDLDRIEVLRGPQGTLYGRNTSGGAVKIYSRQPSTDAVGGRAEAFYGNYDRWSLRGAVNLPLADGIATRISVSHDQQDTGFQRQVPTIASALNGRTVNKDKSTTVRGALLLDRGGSFHATLSGDYSELNAIGRYNSTLSDKVAARPGDGRLAPTRGYNKDELNFTQSPLPLENTAREGGASFNVTGDIGGGVQLQSITAWRNYKFDLGLDLNNGGVRLFTSGSGDQFSQEVKFSGKAADGRLNYVFGVFGFLEDTNQAFVVDLPLAPVTLQRTLNSLSTQAYAGYGQIDYAITDKLKLIAGIRYSNETKDVQVTSFNGAGAVTYNTQSVTALGLPTRLHFERWTPKAGLQFDISADHHAYATYTRGFKGGGFNSTVGTAANFRPFDPETVDSYEVGLKNQFLNNRLRANLAAFYSDYGNIQFDQFGAGNAVITGNVGKARIYGGELEVDAAITPTLRLFGFASYLNSKVRALAPTAVQAGIRVGNRILNTPEWQTQIGVDWRIVDGLSARVTHNFTDKLYNNAQNDPYALIPSNNIVDARLRYEAPGSKFFIQAECDNCFNERFYLTRLSVAPGYVVQPNNPRTYGVRAGLNF